MVDEPQEPQPLHAEEVVAKASDVFTVILSSLERQEAGLSRVEDRVDTTMQRMDTLIETTNHRLDDFRVGLEQHRTETAQSLLAYQSTVNTALQTKMDKDELITDVLIKNRKVQMAIGAVVVALGPVVASNWGMIIQRISSVFP